MKKSSTFYTLLLMVFACTVAVAQIPNDSPFPVTISFADGDGNSTQLEYVSTSDFGDTLSKTVTAELALAVDDAMWDGDDEDDLPDEAYTNGNENCNPTMSDVTGKIAVIRRGSCSFSLKIYNAQEAGAVGVIICNAEGRDPVGGMSGADSAALVVIPAVFVELDACAPIYSALESDQTLTGTFKVSFAYSAFGPTTYGTPISQVSTLGDLEFTVFNPSPSDAATDVMGTVEILEPGGTVTTLEATLDNIDPLMPGIVAFDDYTPTEIGVYNITYTNSLNEDVLTRSFELTDFTFQADNGNVVMTTAGTIEPSDEGFVEDGLNYDAGIFYVTGDEAPTVTHASFMISNPDEIYTGDEDSDLFTIILYDTDADGDGVTSVGTGITYDDLRPVAFGTYVIQEDDQPFQLNTVEFDSPQMLRANNQYILMVRYNGVNAAVGIPPKYAFAGNDNYISLAQSEDGTASVPVAGNDVVFTDQLYTGGWAGSDYNYVIRLHLDGFEPGALATVDMLDEGSVAIAPNPTTDMVNVTFNLNETADDVTVRLFDFAGKMISSTRYENVNQTTLPVNLNNLPSGTYFLSVETPEGFSAQKITKL